MPGTEKQEAIRNGRGTALAVDAEAMDYIIALVIAVLVVPLLLLGLSRRSASRGGITTRSRGMTVAEPSADQPTPGEGTNRAAPGAERRIPPG